MRNTIKGHISRRQALGVIAATAGASLVTGSRHAWADQTANIGTLCPLSGAGGSHGGAMEQAVRYQIDHINQLGGAGGFKFAGFYENSETDPTAAVLGAKKLISVNNVSAVLGEWGSGETLAVSPICIANKVVQMTSAGDDKITDQDHQGYVFRTEPGGVLWGKAFAAAAQNAGAKRAAVASVQASFALAYTDNFRKSFNELGGEVIGDTVIYAASATTYRAELERILSGDPELVCVTGYTPDCVILIKDAFRAGSKAKWLVPGYVALDPEFAKAAGPEAAAGVLGINPAPNRGSPNWKSYIEIMGENPPQEAAQAFDQITLVILAVELMKKVDGTSVRDGIKKVTAPGGKVVTSLDEGINELRNGTSIKYEGVSGPCNFDERNSIRAVQFTVHEIQNGQPAQIGEVAVSV